MTDLQPMIDAARQAAALCREVQMRYLASESVAQKAGAEPVTIADYGAQAIICRAISQAFPDDAIIAEEGGSQFAELISSGDQQTVSELIGAVLGEPVSVAQVVQWLDYGQERSAARTWVIDPIDGTKGFIALRQYAIAIGLLIDGQVREGVMATPGYHDQGAIFYTADGGTFAEALSGGSAQQVHASQRTEPASLVALESFEKAHSSQSLTEQLRERAGFGAAQVIRIDSQEKYAQVAAGDADIYLRLPNPGNTRPHMSWDHAAGVALVQAAGGVVSDVDGSPLDFTHGKTLAANKGMIVANPRIHAQLVKAAMALQSEQHG